LRIGKKKLQKFPKFIYEKSQNKSQSGNIQLTADLKKIRNDFDLEISKFYLVST
jgi:hypothetical protein